MPDPILSDDTFMPVPPEARGNDPRGGDLPEGAFISVPVAPGETGRLEALRACGVMDTPPERDFDDLTALASELTGSPIALISLVDDKRQWFKSRVGIGVSQTAREMAFCTWVIASGTTMMVPDATRDERFRTNPLVTGELRIRMYAGAPLRLSDGHIAGTLCVIDRVARTLSPAQLRQLEALGRQAASQLELRRTVRNLREANERAELAHKMVTRTSEELRAAHAIAETASQAKSMFLANMSHEIRTPITAILGFTDIILSDVGAPPEVREHAAIVRRNAEHLLGVITDVLDLSRIESGRIALDPGDAAVREAVADAAASSRGAATAKGLALEVSIDESVPALARVDGGRLRQVVVNLVANAVKYTDAGTVSVRIHASRPDAAGTRRLEVRVRDTGPGIPSDIIPKLFQPFELVDPSFARRHSGTGLGLCISRALCRLMGGDLTVDSTPGRGSEFTATIMLAPASARLEGSGPAAEGSDSDAESSRPLAGARVLLVEDGPDNQRLLRTILSRAGATVEIEPDGGRAVRRLLTSPSVAPAPDLVLMDVQMPGLDGYGATRTLRAAGVRTPIVALTAHALVGERERCLACGCDDYLTKPIDKARLLAACRRWVAAAKGALPV